MMSQHVGVWRSSLAGKDDDDDACACQGHMKVKEPLLCSYRSPMILEDLHSCYSSPLHPMSRSQCQQQSLWVDTTEQTTSFNSGTLQAALNTGVVNNFVDPTPACCQTTTVLAGTTYPDDACADFSEEDTRCAAAGLVTSSSQGATYCNCSDCRASPCAVCRLLSDDIVPPSVEYVQNDRRRQHCKLTRQGDTPSTCTPCGTPLHNSTVIDD